MRFVLPFLLISTSAFAQQDPAFLQRALVAIQIQRNQALDNDAACRANSEGISAELAKAKERIAELEKAQKKE